MFGGDGGYTLVDPANSNNVITEYTGLTALKSTDGGENWHFITPADPDPRFIAPINMDRTNPNHLVAGGAFVWNSEAGIAGTTAGTGAVHRLAEHLRRPYRARRERRVAGDGARRGNGQRHAVRRRRMVRAVQPERSRTEAGSRPAS